jgi:Cu/Ag efflux pump CusA
VFGILVSTLLTLVVIPVLYYAVNRTRYPAAVPGVVAVRA